MSEMGPHKSFSAEADGASTLREASSAFLKPEQITSPRRDLSAATELVEKASAAIDSLQARCKHLEAEVKEARERAKLEVEAAESIAAEWQKLARATKAQLEDCEKRLAMMKQTADAAEARAEMAKERLESVQKIASDEADQTARFHDKVVASLGVGSRAHGVIAALES